MIEKPPILETGFDAVGLFLLVPFRSLGTFTHQATHITEGIAKRPFKEYLLYE